MSATNEIIIMTIAQQMFMLLFSILYGIMLNSLIGLRAFAYGYAFAGEAVRKKEKDKPGDPEDKPCKTEKSSVTQFRIISALFLLNILPFIYFAVIFFFINDIVGTISLESFWHTVFQILSIGFFSLAVFAFQRLFIGLIVANPSPIYTTGERQRIINERCIHGTARYQLYTALILLFVLPIFFACLSRIVEWLP